MIGHGGGRPAIASPSWPTCAGNDQSDWAAAGSGCAGLADAVDILGGSRALVRQCVLGVTPAGHAWGLQAIPEYQQHERLIGARPGTHGEEDARQQRGKFGAADIGANGASTLGPGEQAGDLGTQVIGGGRHPRADLRPGAGQRVEQVSLGSGLGGQKINEREEGRAGIAGIAERGAFGGQAAKAVLYYRLDQGLLGGKVTVERAGPDAGTPGDLIQRNRQAVGRERGPGGTEKPLAVLPGIGSQRPGVRHVTSRSGRWLKAGRSLRYCRAYNRGDVSDYSFRALGGHRIMPPVTRSPRETVEQLLRSAVSATPGDMADCYAPEVVIEMPFAVGALYPPLIETTREELRTRFQAGTTIRQYKALRNVTIHETADPEVIIAEYELHGELAGTGESFSVRFAMVITIRDGYIERSRDYTDPIAGARLLGRLPELVSALS
jgi:ketosteroid isomerase-like protein